MSNPPPPYVSAEQCREVLTPLDVVERVRTALEWDAAGAIHWPQPRSLNIAPDKWGNDYHMKACVLEEIPVAGLRIVSHPLDESSPQCTRLILLVDPATALPLALVDESWNYVQRTVASIAMAAHSVANPDAANLTVVGAGRLAETGAQYYASLFDLDRVTVVSRTPARRDAMADRLRAELGVEVVTQDSVREAVEGADLVLTATSSSAAVIEEAWVKPGATVACVGTAEPGAALVERSDLFVVDSPDQLRKELVELYGAEAPGWITASVGEVVTGAHPGRTDPSQRALIITEGMASQDIALAYLAYQRVIAS
ncbi:MAG: alanine dehydrogenase [Nocardioides sp.]|nr:alanine dehydrogenase [Nocardioides sp.]